MPDNQTVVRLLDQLASTLQELRNQFSGGSPNASDLPTESEREQMQFQRRQQAIRYQRDYGREIPAHLDYVPDEVNQAGDLMRRHGWDFERAVAAIRAGR